MKKIVTNCSLIALAAVLSAGLAAAAAGDAAFGAGTTEEKLVLVGEGADAETFSLADLADGESRTFQGKTGTVTVSRKGDSFEVKIDGEDGAQHITVTTGGGDGEEGRLVIRKIEGGDEPHVIVMRHAGAKDGAAWTGEDGKVIEIEEGDGHAVFVGAGPHRHVFVGEGGEHATVVGTGDGFSWSTGGTEMLHFRCADDDVIVGGPKVKLDTLAPVCPVCGKAMQKLEGARHRTVEVKVLKEEAAEKPQI
jgi:hypothetical protein